MIGLNRETGWGTASAGFFFANSLDGAVMNDLKSPFHPGEEHIQERLGIKDMLAPVAGQFIRDFMPDQHRAFFAQLPFLALGSVDEDGRPWASLVAGEPGFVSSPDNRLLRIDALPLFGALKDGQDIGLLGIELETRRRNRLSGVVQDLNAHSFEISVKQSFGNCPKYIQTRGVEYQGLGVCESKAASPAKTFDDRAAAIIGKADTFFIATSYQGQGSDWSHGCDVSHRGGKPGFMRQLDERRFVFPDFTGNHFFNTLGNIMLNPKAGIFVPDFDTGAALFMTGEAKIIWDSPEMRAFKGAQRLVQFTLDELIHVAGALPFRFEFGDYSPLLERLGHWPD